MKQLSCHVRTTNSYCGRYLLIAGLFFIGLIACLAIGVSTASAQTYSLTDLGVVPGMEISEPAAINNSGQVAGVSTAGEHYCAFRYDIKEMKDIGGLGSRGFGISDSGLVAGDSTFRAPYGSVSHAAIFKDGPVADLGVLRGGEYSRANGINAWQQVVGFSGPNADGEDSRAFVWTWATGMVDIGTLGGPYAQATAINDAGFITGTAQTAQAKIGATHAFLYQTTIGERFIKPMIDLGTLGGSSSYGMAINASSHVVGYSKINSTDNRVHAFLYDGGKMIDLGSLGGTMMPTIDHSVALGINNADQVVGYSYASSGHLQAQAAFIYSPGLFKRGMVDLNQQIGNAANEYWLFSAAAINDKGQIVASAYDKGGVIHAVLLTPIASALRSEKR